MALSPMAEKILAYVRRSGDASFANLHTLIGPEADGPYFWELGGPNIILDFNCSEQFLSALNELRPFIEPKSCHMFVYLADGRIPCAPIAKRPTSKGYREPHWLPVVFVERDEASQAEYREKNPDGPPKLTFPKDGS